VHCSEGQSLCITNGPLISHVSSSSVSEPAEPLSRSTADGYGSQIFRAAFPLTKSEDRPSSTTFYLNDPLLRNFTNFARTFALVNRQHINKARVVVVVELHGANDKLIFRCFLTSTFRRFCADLSPCVHSPRSSYPLAGDCRPSTRQIAMARRNLISERSGVLSSDVQYQ